MSGIFGALNISDSNRDFVNHIGQQIVFDAVQELLRVHNEVVTELSAIFIEKTTELYQERYMLPGGGELQALGRMGPPQAVKRYGSFDVAYPLRMWGAQQAGNRVDLAYLTMQEIDASLDTIMLQDLNTLRRRIMTAIFEDTQLTYEDEIHGTLYIKHLANGDATLYPPVHGSEIEAADNHYSETDYGITSIDEPIDNPIVTLRDEVIEHFGGRTTEGRQFVVLHNEDATPWFAKFSGYTKIEESFLKVGDDTATLSGMPPIPGRLHGRASGAWLSEWAWMPATFMIGILLDAPPPLVRRVDPADTGLSPGLQLIQTDVVYPMRGAFYENRYGIAVGNRLSAAVIEVSGEGGSYTPPTGYTEG